MGSLRRLGWLAAVLVGGGLVTGGAWIMTSAGGTSKVEFSPPTRSDRFDPGQSFRYLETICALGPRMTATPAMARQIEALERHFTALGATVERQAFQGTQPSQRRPFSCVNLLVQWHPEKTRRVLLGAHYDTRPLADMEPVARRKNEPILGANDGGSGVAFLMELGRVIPSLDLAVGVDFVFFDAEEFIFEPGIDRFFLGSEEFVRNYRQRPPPHRYEAVIVVDMIGDRDLEIFPDERSAARAGPLVDEVWSVARELGVQSFRPQVRYDILDDHVAFQNAGIPAIVLIDFGYPHWHRLTDTPDKCSGESLETVARVLIEWLKRRK